MKKMYVLDKSGSRLFAGTRNDCKNYIKRTKVKDYKLTEKFVEKVIIEEKQFNAIPNHANHLAKPATKEGWFNRLF